MTGLDAVLAMLTRAGIPATAIDPRTIEYYLRHGYQPHQIVTDVYRVHLSAIRPDGQPS